MKLSWIAARRHLTPPTGILIPAVLGQTVGVDDEYQPGKKYQHLYKLGILNASPPIAEPDGRKMHVRVVPLVLYWWCETLSEPKRDTDIGWLHQNIKAMFDAALNYRDPYRFERFMFHLLSIEHAVKRAEADPTKPIHTWQVITMPPPDADNDQFPPSHYAFDGLKNSATTLPAGSYLPGDPENQGFDFAIYEPGKMLKLYECKYSATHKTTASHKDWEGKISKTVKQLAPALPDTINRLFDQDVTGRTEPKLSYTLDIKEDQVHLEFLSLQNTPAAFQEPAANNKPDRVTVQSKADILNKYPQWRSFLFHVCSSTL